MGKSIILLFAAWIPAPALADPCDQVRAWAEKPCKFYVETKDQECRAALELQQQSWNSLAWEIRQFCETYVKARLGSAEEFRGKEKSVLEFKARAERIRDSLPPCPPENEVASGAIVKNENGSHFLAASAGVEQLEQLLRRDYDAFKELSKREP